MSFCRSITSGITAAVLCLGLLPHGAAAQGGWRQWDVYLRDGRHIIANPLGAPDNRRLSTSFHYDAASGTAIERSDVDYIAARTDRVPDPFHNVPLPPPPAGKCGRDVVVRLDGRRTHGRVTLANIRFSEGVIEQNGVEINLTEVAYIKFGRNP